MPVLTEEAKRAEKQEIGDLVIEIVGRTTRIHEIVSTTRVKQIAYSDTFQGDRFLMFHEPANKMAPAKDFTISRLYKKPEKARKIIARLFPKYAAAGAKAHLYYAGKGPRGKMAGTGDGYFTVALGLGIGESIDEATITLRPGVPQEVTLTIERGKVTAIQERGKTVPVSDAALQRIRSIHGAAVKRLSPTDRKAWDSITWPPNFGDLRAGQPFEHKGKRYIKLFKSGARTSEVLSVDTGKVTNLGFTGALLVKPVKRVTIGEDNYSRLIAVGLKYLGESDMSTFTDERFDPRTAHDYVKGIRDRKRRAYAREYLKAIQGARLPPRPQDFKITARDAEEVKAGFKRVGAPLAASVEHPDRTFEQVARIVRRAKGAGFEPGRISLNERFDSSGVPRLRREFVKRPKKSAKKSAISTEDYIFIVHDDEEDTYSVGLSVHDDPRLGYQELETGLSQRAASRFERKMKARWKAAKVRRFLKVGHGHERKWLPESDAEKTKRIKAEVDVEVKDPKNKGRTIVQVLRRMFKQDVNEARKWAPVWTTSAKKPWRIADQDGKYLRKPKEGNVRQAYAFESAKKAAAFLKSSQGKKAVTTQESIDEARVPALQGWKMRKGMNKLGVNAATHRHGAFSIMRGKDQRYHLFKGGNEIGDYESAKAAVKAARDVKESIDERRFGQFSKGMPMISKATARRHLDRLGKDYKKYKKAGDIEKANDTLAVIRGMARMADMDPDAAFKFAGVHEDLDEQRRKVIDKKPKEEVNYRESREDIDGDKRCGTCAFIEMPDACTRVRGKIDQDFRCDLWKKGVQEDLDEALSKKARSVFSALEQNPEGISADKLKHYGRAGEIANLPAFLKKFVKKGWVEKKGDLYLPTAAYWKAEGKAPWIPFAKAKALKNAVFSIVNWIRAGKSEVILYDRKGKQLARTHATITGMKQLPGLPISWTDLMWIERHGEPSPGVQMRMKEDLDEVKDYNRPIDPEKWGVSMFKVAPPGRSELHVMLPPDADKKLIDKIINSVSGQLITRTKKKMTWLTKGRRFKQEMVAKIIRGWKEKTGWATLGYESIDEAAAQGKVQAALLDFVNKLPANAEYTLSDVMRRREFHNIHFKRLMSAAKVLEKKGLIWYDGFSNVGPLRA